MLFEKALAAVTESTAVALFALKPPPEHDNAKELSPSAAIATLSVPPEGCAPLHAPLAVHDVPALAVQVSVAFCPCVIDAGETESETVAVCDGGVA